VEAVVAKHAFRIGSDRQPALDIVSYGRRGPGHPDRFTTEQVAQIGRTVRRAPEVMVKVSGGGRSPGAFLAHLRYISRRGELQVETDDGERHQGREVPAMLVEDWDLEIDAALDRWERIERGGRVMVPKLVHNIVLSMPAATSPGRLMAASREFAREEFALQHRNAMVLHTDQDHPHVHLVVSAHRLEGGRLNIRKADLRRWREEFARQLRRQGVDANATPVQIRGKLSDQPRDGVYRTTLRSESRVEWKRATRAVGEAAAPLSWAVSVGRIFDTANAVQRDWLITSNVLQKQGLGMLAAEVAQFRQSLSVPRTRRERAIAVVRRASAESPAPQLDLIR
jgi:hypothetical protein